MSQTENLKFMKFPFIRGRGNLCKFEAIKKFLSEDKIQSPSISLEILLALMIVMGSNAL
jgi:hypothetical protein